MIGSNENGSADGIEFKADLTLERLKPRLEEVWRDSGIDETQRCEFERRLREHWRPLFEILFRLYGSRYDFFYHVEQILLTAAAAWADRPAELRDLDRIASTSRTGFSPKKLSAGRCTSTCSAKTLSKLREHVGYFQKLGLTYLHLMPLFAVRPGNNDGGYAISNYRSVDPRLGTIDDLRMLADDLRDAGICLVLDFVFNHTADDHDWAQQAQAGDREYQEFYYLFPDRTHPEQYERHSARNLPDGPPRQLHLARRHAAMGLDHLQ